MATCQGIAPCVFENTVRELPGYALSACDDLLIGKPRIAAMPTRLHISPAKGFLPLSVHCQSLLSHSSDLVVI